MNSTKAIKTFFEADGGRPVKIEELKALPKDYRDELGKLACDALGEPWEPLQATTASA